MPREKKFQRPHVRLSFCEVKGVISSFSELPHKQALIFLASTLLDGVNILGNRSQTF